MHQQEFRIFLFARGSEELDIADLGELKTDGVCAIAGPGELANGVLNSRDDLEALLSGGLTICDAARCKGRPGSVRSMGMLGGP